MKVHYYKRLGRFDLCSNRKDWQVSLHTPFGKLSELWPEDDEPMVDDLLPTEVIDMIEKRLMESQKVKVHYYKRLGRFDLCSNRKDWQVSLHTPFGKLSELWPEDDEPMVDDLLPTEVIDMIEKRLATYWINTSREEKKAVIAELRAHGREIDTMWCEYGVEVAKKRLEQAEQKLASVKDAADEAA